MDSIKLFIVIFILSISSIGGYYYYKEYTKQNSVSPATTLPTTPNTPANRPITPSTPPTTPTTTPTTTPNPPAVAPINCYGEWTPWSACSKTCGGGTQNRTYNVKTQGNSAPCPFKDGQTENQDCNKQGCPVDCVGSWSDWSSCGAYTTGSQRRTYVISQPAINGGKACPIREGETETKGCPINCIGSWSDWSECSGCSGTKTRKYTIRQPAMHGGTACPANDGAIESQNCTKDCNCQLSAWSNWSACGNCVRGCPSGTTNNGGICWSTCPAGYGDTGLFCVSGSNFIPKTNSVPLPMGTQTRTRTVIQPQVGNGAACDVTSQQQSCNC
jgi:hypothetical protein